MSATQVRTRSFVLSSLTSNRERKQGMPGLDREEAEAQDAFDQALKRYRNLNYWQRASRNRAAANEVYRRMLIIYGPLLTVGYGVIFCLCCLLPPLGIPAALGAVGITAGSGIGLYFTVIRDGYTAGARDWDRAHGYYSEIPDLS